MLPILRASFSLVRRSFHSGNSPIAFEWAGLRRCSSTTTETQNYKSSLMNDQKETSSAVEGQKRDKLYKQIDLELRGHDPAVLRSYIIFLLNVCNHLEIERSKPSQPTRKGYHAWRLWANRAKFAKKKYKLHYEIRTHIRQMSVYHLTGSTASTFLEYIQRNIPEGVGMKISHTEVRALPDAVFEEEDTEQNPPNATS